MNEVKRRAGRLGGLARAANHSHEELSSYSKTGGRPRNKTLDEIRQQQAPSDLIEKIRGGWPPNRLSLKELRELVNKQYAGRLAV